MSRADRHHDLMRVWNILVKAAAARRTLTYGALADELGGRNAGYVPRFMSGRFLNPIKDYCDSRGLPRLTDLVVAQASKEPGYSEHGHDFASERARIATFKWGEVTVNGDDILSAHKQALARRKRSS